MFSIIGTMDDNIKVNYDKEMKKVIEALPEGVRPRLLLHSCCAPCSTAVLERLLEHFKVTVFFDNPNLYPQKEFDIRVEEQARLLAELSSKGDIALKVVPYQPERYNLAVAGVEHLPEGSERCFRCYALRLEECARVAAEEQFEFFTTTLSVSPHKNAKVLNALGKVYSEKYGVPYLYSDFKKQEGFKRSIQLSEEHHLYRQDYCGCIYSYREALERQRQKNAGDSSSKTEK